VLAADTTVALAGEILGKPSDREDAERMLAKLSGTQHRVLTAVALQFDSRVELAVSESLVTFATLDAARIASYVASASRSTRPGLCDPGPRGRLRRAPRGQLTPGSWDCRFTRRATSCDYSG
jgi:predicted house-cleaning NTP pyrophosphatase (Maf/HAM1 superfamily)